LTVTRAAERRINVSKLFMASALGWKSTYNEVRFGSMAVVGSSACSIVVAFAAARRLRGRGWSSRLSPLRLTATRDCAKELFVRSSYGVAAAACASSTSTSSIANKSDLHTLMHRKSGKNLRKIKATRSNAALICQPDQSDERASFRLGAGAR